MNDVASRRLKASHNTVRVILIVINVRRKGDHGFGSGQELQNKSELEIRQRFEFIMGFCQNIDSNTTRSVESSMRLPHFKMNRESVLFLMTLSEIQQVLHNSKSDVFVTGSLHKSAKSLKECI